MEMEIEDDDSIIEEIPIYCSSILANNLYLLQFPNKNANVNIDETEVVNCCAKPINSEIKIEFGIDAECQFYDEFKGKQFATAADGKQKDLKCISFKSGVMDKQAFVSTKPLENANNYVIGILQDKEIHVTPLKQILHMRPNFSYFDKEDKRNKAEQKAAAAAASNNEDDDDDLQQVTVKFSRSDSDKVKKAREKTFDFHVKKSAEEPWFEIFWHTKNSPTSELEKQKIFATKQETIEHMFCLNSNQYIETLIPPERSDESLESILPSKIIGKSKLKSMNLQEQLKNILKDARMISFDDIIKFISKLNSEATTEKVLRTLPIVGILLRGNWIVQSEILYPPGTMSNYNGVASDFMIRGRDYLIYKFSKQEFLYRRKIVTATQLPTEEATEILNSISKLNSEKKWELLLPSDTQFEQRHVELFQRQEMVWRATEQMYEQMDYEKSPKRIHKRSVREIKIEKT